VTLAEIAAAKRRLRALRAQRDALWHRNANGLDERAQRKADRIERESAELQRKLLREGGA
jgi:hypothetical protein